MKIEMYLKLVNDMKQIYAVYYSGEKLAEGVGPEFQAVRQLKKSRIIDDKDEVIVYAAKKSGGWEPAITGSVKKLAALNVIGESSGMGVNSRRLVGSEND